jgi:hypothetical protein
MAKEFGGYYPGYLGQPKKIFYTLLTITKTYPELS